MASLSAGFLAHARRTTPLRPNCAGGRSGPGKVQRSSERLGTDAIIALLDLFNGVKAEWSSDVTERTVDRFERRLVEETSRLRVDMTQGLPRSARRSEVRFLGWPGVRDRQHGGAADPVHAAGALKWARLPHHTSPLTARPTAGSQGSVATRPQRSAAAPPQRRSRPAGR